MLISQQLNRWCPDRMNIYCWRHPKMGFPEMGDAQTGYGLFVFISWNTLAINGFFWVPPWIVRVRIKPRSVAQQSLGSQSWWKRRILEIQVLSHTGVWFPWDHSDFGAFPVTKFEAWLIHPSDVICHLRPDLWPAPSSVNHWTSRQWKTACWMFVGRWADGPFQATSWVKQVRACCDVSHMPKWRDADVRKIQKYLLTANGTSHCTFHMIPRILPHILRRCLVHS